MELSSHLTRALLLFPQLLDDIPAMIASLDTGESVNTDAIKDAHMREELVKILRCLPLQYESRSGWYKRPEIVSVGGVLLMELLDAGSIKQPGVLNEAEALASRSAPQRLLTLLASFPELRLELPMLFDSLLDGQALQVDGMDNIDVAAGLRLLLRSLGLLESVDGWSIPAGPEKVSVMRSLKSLKFVLILGGVDCASASTSKDNSVSQSRKRRLRSASVSSGDSSSRDRSSSNDSEDSRSGADDEFYGQRNQHKLDVQVTTAANNVSIAPASASLLTSNLEMGSQPVSRRVQAPSLPPDFKCASNLNKEEEDDEEEIGPLPSWQAARRTVSQPSVAASAPENSALLKALSTQIPSGNCGAQSEGSVASITGGREEWMLTPGDSKAMAALEGSFGKQRKFAAGKQASQAAQALQARKAAADATARAAPIDTELAASLEEYKQLRGPSLMELHAQKAAANDAAKRGGAGTTFDYARDVGSFRRRVDTTVRNQMVADAAQLDTRFDKSVQR